MKSVNFLIFFVYLYSYLGGTVSNIGTDLLFDSEGNPYIVIEKWNGNRTKSNSNVTYFPSVDAILVYLGYLKNYKDIILNFSRLAYAYEISLTSKVTQDTVATLKIDSVDDCISFNWSSPFKEFQLLDCIDGKDSSWHGGPELYEQHLFSRKGLGNIISSRRYEISNNLFANRKKFGCASVPFWYTSGGWSVQLDRLLENNFNISLNVDKMSSAEGLQGDGGEIEVSSLCLSRMGTLKYRICGHQNMRSAWRSTVLYVLESTSPTFTSLASASRSTSAAAKSSRSSTSSSTSSNQYTPPMTSTQSLNNQRAFSQSVWHVDNILAAGTPFPTPSLPPSFPNRPAFLFDSILRMVFIHSIKTSV